jgi:hypothetical protein
MARTKHGPSLFEVMRPEAPGRDVPEVSRRNRWHFLREWFGDGRGEPAGEPAAEATAESGIEEMDETAERRGPRLAIRGRHLTVSLTSREAAIAVFSIIILLFVVFAAGDRLGQADYQRGFADGRALAGNPVDELAELQSRPPTPGLVDGLLVGSAGSSASRDAGRRAPSAESGGTWTPGSSYIVAQEFAADRKDDAVKAQSFLRENGVAAEVVTLLSGRLQLIAVQGFNTKDVTQKSAADALLKKVHDLGAKYFASGGGYRMQGYLKTFKGDRW